MPTTVAPVFFARPIPSSPKWSEWPCVAAMTSTLPNWNPFGNFGLCSMNGSSAIRTPLGDSIRNAACPSHVTLPPNDFFATTALLPSAILSPPRAHDSREHDEAREQYEKVQGLERVRERIAVARVRQD